MNGGKGQEEFGLFDLYGPYGLFGLFGVFHAVLFRVCMSILFVYTLASALLQVEGLRCTVLLWERSRPRILVAC